MNRENGLPLTWSSVPLGELGRWYGGGTPSKTVDRFWKGGDIPWFSPKDMKSFRLQTSEDRITKAAIESAGIDLFPELTVLMVVRSGILSHTFPVSIAGVRGTMNQDLKGLVPNDGIDPNYVAYALRSSGRNILRACSKEGTTVASIDTAALHRYEIPIAPTNEQCRIVRKLDELLSDLDAGTAALELVRTNLKRYRAAVLKAAVEGRLTEKWRAEHRDVEPASKLLERILAERRKKWEGAQLKRYAEKKQLPPKGWNDKYSESERLDTTNLPSLPTTWCWASWSQVGSSQNGRPFPSKDYCNAGIRLLRPGNFYASGVIGWTPKNTRYLPERYAGENPDLIVRGGEIVMNLTAQSLKDEFLGRTCITSNDDRCLLNQRLARLMPVLVLPRFVLWLFKSAWFRRFVDDLNTGSLIQHMFTSQIERFVLPLPPLAEQQAIVEAVEERLSVVEHLELQIANNLTSAGNLRQAILKRAFEGRLERQNPKDEPASELLARIKKHREGVDAVVAKK